MTALLSQIVAATVGQPIASVVRVTGGDINQAYCVTLARGERVFVKTNAEECLAMFCAESDGLRYLADAQAFDIPRVIACGSAPGAGLSPGLAYLILEWLEPASRASGFDEMLGRRLAALHRFGAPRFGGERDNYIGRLTQRNRSHDDFASFYREERLIPQVERAFRAGLFDAALAARFERLYSRLEQLLGPVEPPSRVHGDLWSGNCLVGPNGAPWLIDPAVYGGHREIDLAMMRLFGGFSSTVYASYAESYPLSPGYPERVSLMQLYPLLVHVNLFGGGYVAAVRRVLASYE